MLFADVSESGNLYQKLGDTAARNIIDGCIGVLSGVLPRFEGILTKTLGDAILCLFPTADLAVLAAGEMQAAVTQLRTGGHAVAIHIGVAYGPVLLEDGDVFGDTVNVAAYLTAVAMREQILATEATSGALSPPLRSCIRPVFQTVLKGSMSESMVFQVLWKTDRMEITDVNLPTHKTIPGDTGSLMVSLGDARVRVDQLRPTMTMGRAEDCDLVVTDPYASRKHLTIRLMRTRFYLIDHSINGTFVTLDGGPEVHVLRQDLPLDSSGEIALGRSRAANSDGLISFSYDRRSMYRV
ncbi:MAG TPA: adenylate/guanylate cyclase domain-containing protein [Burkholderiales bacterium]|nr:adenylate/guanylate cyclase domain-containing protein [Burkholderiales bacterium]